jgi:hypothetical protein
MKKMSVQKMENIQGGKCEAEVAGGVVSIFGLAGALAATGVGAGFGVALGVVGFGLAMYSAIECGGRDEYQLVNPQGTEIKPVVDTRSPFL